MFAEKLSLPLPDEPEVRTALLCARQHLRDGKRHLQRGASVKGIAALHDAMIFAMRYYISKHRLCHEFVRNIDVDDATGLFYALVRAGVFDDPLVFNRLSLMVERALWQKGDAIDVEALLAQVEILLTKLDVVPFRAHSH